jgi:hypothetical protein
MATANPHVLLEMTDEPDCRFVAAWLTKGDGNPDPVVAGADPDLREALLDIADDRGQVKTQKLGSWLRDDADFIVDGHRLEPEGHQTDRGGEITESSRV